ncbi:hypothetical protein BDR03DRAFT_258069 [Suillus americanus]|nr:hypothetical protein BDR03DRAFT_258069 [Suillus americanus]
MLPLSNLTQLQVPPLSGSTGNLLFSLLSIHTPATSTNHGQQPPPAAPVVFQCQSEFIPTTPSLVKRYNQAGSQTCEYYCSKERLFRVSPVMLLDQTVLDHRRSVVQKIVATGVSVYTLKSALLS